MLEILLEVTRGLCAFDRYGYLLRGRGQSRPSCRNHPLHSFHGTGCSAAWLARLLWVLPGLMSSSCPFGPVTCGFDGRGCGDLTAR